jgi:hypothetical protein
LINGPTLIKVFTCEGCRYLSHNTLLGDYKCYHDKIIKKDLTSYSLLVGDIKYDKITPAFCPFLLRKIRSEKIKKINDKYNK